MDGELRRAERELGGWLDRLVVRGAEPAAEIRAEAARLGRELVG